MARHRHSKRMRARSAPRDLGMELSDAMGLGAHAPIVMPKRPAPRAAGPRSGPFFALPRVSEADYARMRAANYFGRDRGQASDWHERDRLAWQTRTFVAFVLGGCLMAALIGAAYIGVAIKMAKGVA